MSADWNSFDGIKNKVLRFFEQDNAVTRVLSLVERKTNVNRNILVIGSVGLIVLYLAIGWGSRLLCNLIGYVYPAYASILAVESPNRHDDTRWLMYWCVYALFSILETFSDRLLFWIPFYTLNKCIFLIWLMLPGALGGSSIIYNRLILTYFKKMNTE